MTYSTRRESDGMFACYYQGSQESDSRKELHVYDAGGKAIWQIDNLPEAVTAMRFYKDVLVVATDNSRLYAYDARSGAKKGVVEIGKQLYHTGIQIYDGTGGDLIIYGYCRYYSVDDLVEKGKAFVGEQTMSEADMATYGIN